jgi:hypothetical protein
VTGEAYVYIKQIAKKGMYIEFYYIKNNYLELCLRFYYQHLNA